MIAPESILEVARQAGLQLKQLGPHEHAVRCPQHHLHRNGDAHPSCRLNDDKGVFHCDVCGCGGGIVDFAQMVGIGIPNPASSPSSSTPLSSEDKKSNRDRQPLHFESHGPISPATQDKVKQLLGKAYPPEIWGKVGVLEGKVEDFPAIAFPLPSGGCKACLYTRPDPKRGKPYTFWFTDGGKPDLLLIGEGDEVLLTAGEWDMLSALSAGIPCVATGTTGETSWKEEWSEKLAGKRVLIAYDVDETGRRGSERVAGSLSTAGCKAYTVHLPLSGKEEEDGKDLSDFLAVHGVEALREVLAVALSRGPCSPQGCVSQGLGASSSAGKANSANSANFATRNCPGEPISWEPPIPFGDFTLPSFPTEALPGWLREFVKAEALATQTPPDLTGMLGISAVAAACAKKVIVQVKAGHIEPVNLYTVTSLASANRKSPVFADIVRPLEDHEQTEVERKRPIVAAERARYEIAEEALRRAKSEAAKAVVDGRVSDGHETLEMARNLAEMRIPATPRLIVDDTTPEKLSTLLQEQHGRMAVLSPEGGIFDLMAGRYSDKAGPNFEVYLKAHSGDTYRVDRVGRASEYVRNPALTIGLAVQPEVIRGLADKPGFRGRGLLARFLFSMPKSLLGTRNCNAPPLTRSVRDSYYHGLLRLLLIPLPLDEHGNALPWTLRLDPDARQLIVNFETWLEPQLAEFGELGDLNDWAGKLVGAVVRIAGLLHMAENLDNKAPWELSITAESMKGATAIGRYLIPHAKAAFAEMGADPLVQQAKYVVGWLRNRQLLQFTKREVFEGTKGRIRRVGDLDPVLQLLEDHICIRRRPSQERSSPGRPPSPTFDVNPLLYSQYSQYSQNSPSVNNIANSTNFANQEEQGAEGG